MSREIRSYDEAHAYLGGRRKRRTRHRETYLVRVSPTAIAVRYHQTDVVTYFHPSTGKEPEVKDGGWAFKSTHRRIAQYRPEQGRL
jgi:hypothetical protein